MAFSTPGASCHETITPCILSARQALLHGDHACLSSPPVPWGPSRSPTRHGWRRLVVLAALLAMASGGPAEARTAKIALVVSGDEQMQADLKELVERFEKGATAERRQSRPAAGRAGGSGQDQYRSPIARLL